MLSEKEIEALLPKYAAGLVSTSEGQEIDKWICLDAVNRSKAERYLRLEYLQSEADAMDGADTDHALRALHGRMRRERSGRAFSTIKLAAALFSIPLLIATAWLAAELFHTSQLPPVEIRSTAGMTSQTTLPDGTHVWLNSNSSIQYPVRFGRIREVNINGEAYFDVARRDGQKFLVHAGPATIEVTGTQFNVESYCEHSSEIRTTLLSGSVLFHVTDAAGAVKSIRMKPGEQLIYNAGSKSLSRRLADGAIETAWKDGMIILDNTSLEDALRAIGNRFNVEFMVRNEALLSNRYTGIFTGQTLEVVLEHFKRTTKIHFDADLKGADPDNVSGRQIIIVH